VQEDPAAILDIKEDIRDECSKLGDVTNVVLYDKEPDGVVTVRFSDPEGARQCVRVGISHNPAFSEETDFILRSCMAVSLAVLQSKRTSPTDPSDSRRPMKDELRLRMQQKGVKTMKKKDDLKNLDLGWKIRGKVNGSLKVGRNRPRCSYEIFVTLGVVSWIADKWISVFSFFSFGNGEMMELVCHNS
jgi:hypothetical protein